MYITDDFVQQKYRLGKVEVSGFLRYQHQGT